MSEFRELSAEISIHAPREGSDESDVDLYTRIHISIHAPREGSDQSPAPAGHCRPHFNPRSP